MQQSPVRRGSDDCDARAQSVFFKFQKSNSYALLWARKKILLVSNVDVRIAELFFSARSSCAQFLKHAKLLVLKRRGRQKYPSLTHVVFGCVACPRGENPFTVTGNLDINK